MTPHEVPSTSTDITGAPMDFRGIDGSPVDLPLVAHWFTMALARVTRWRTWAPMNFHPTPIGYRRLPWVADESPMGLFVDLSWVAHGSPVGIVQVSHECALGRSAIGARGLPTGSHG